eukprot:TRINITY_DN3979_c0_g1_i1.p1 TRINITY_DN3979_c0_g1~~TRINITY_DN3979_c0_g1_i1.p1  ORF type:complete len:345 (-),score=131.16 TRINITY_DN3979_c0_g1_i1:918-1952(-)
MAALAAAEQGEVQLVPAPAFPEPVFEWAKVVPHFPPGLIDEEGQLIAGKVLTGSGGKRWELIRCLRDCIHGQVVLAAGFTLSGIDRIYEERHSVVKVLYRDRIENSAIGLLENPYDEIAAMQLIAARGGHPSILPITAALRDENTIYLVLPFCNGGDLFDYVNEGGGLTEEQARPLFRQLADGLAFLQREDIAILHRDMSLENVLMHDGAALLVMDFGMSIRLPRAEEPGVRALIPPQTRRGKRSYMSPEVFAEMPFDAKADVWALGVMCYVMLLRRLPYSWPHNNDEYFRLIAHRHELAVRLQQWGFNVSAEAADLMQRCLMADAQQRPTAAELLQHPWISGH